MLLWLLLEIEFLSQMVPFLIAGHILQFISSDEMIKGSLSDNFTW